MTGRNQDALKKTTAGLLKLIFPHRDAQTIRRSELDTCLEVAVEMRRRILEQLAIIKPEEFKEVSLEYSAKGRS